jgi:UbiD family decarboxylase
MTTSKGFRPASGALTGVPASRRRAAVVLGLDPELSKLELIRSAADSIGQYRSIRPAVIEEAPILGDVFFGADADVEKFPVPLFAAMNGGRFSGTGCSPVNRDPTSGYVNLGSCRMQVHGRDRLGLRMSPGQQGKKICEAYWKRGGACPVVATSGETRFSSLPPPSSSSRGEHPNSTSSEDCVGRPWRSSQV